MFLLEIAVSHPTDSFEKESKCANGTLELQGAVILCRISRIYSQPDVYFL